MLKRYNIKKLPNWVNLCTICRYIYQVSEEDAVAELTAPVAAVVLTLLCNLRHCFLTDQSEVAQLHDISHYITLLDAAGKLKYSSLKIQLTLHLIHLLFVQYQNYNLSRFFLSCFLESSFHHSTKLKVLVKLPPGKR